MRILKTPADKLASLTKTMVQQNGGSDELPQGQIDVLRHEFSRLDTGLSLRNLNPRVAWSLHSSDGVVLQPNKQDYVKFLAVEGYDHLLESVPQRSCIGDWYL